MKKKGIIIGAICGVVGAIISIGVAVMVIRDRKKVWCHLKNANEFSEGELFDINDAINRLRNDLDKLVREDEDDDSGNFDD